MWIKSLRDLLDRQRPKKRGRRLPPRRQRTVRLNLEQLEDRSLPSIALVANLGGATEVTDSTAISITVPPKTAVAGGEIIIEFAMHANTPGQQVPDAISATDTAGNTYTVVADTVGANQVGGGLTVRTVILVAQDVNVSGLTSITVDYPTTDLAAVSAAEFTGLAVTPLVDQTSVADGGSKTPNSGPVTTSVSSELLIGAIGFHTTSATTFTAEPGFTPLTLENATNKQDLGVTIAPEFQIVSSISQYDASGTLSASRPWEAVIATFEAALPTPTLTTTPNETTVTLNSAPVTLTDTATLSGGATPTGTITFTLDYNGVPTTESETVTVTGDGSYTTPVGFTLPTTGTVTGTYQWDATYSGDSNNNSVSDDNDPAEQVVVSPASPPPPTGTGSLTLTTTPVGGTTVTLGNSPETLTDTADLEGAYFPTGTITFTLDYNGVPTTESETVTVNGDGPYTTPTGFTLPTTGTVTGTYQWDATYSGDGNNDAISDNGATDEQVVVSPASPPPPTGTGNLSLTTMPNVTTVTLSGVTPPVLTDTADLEGAYSPTGTITFTLDHNGVPTTESETVTVNGDGPYTTPVGFTLPTTGTVTGTYQWDATYSGDGNNDAISDDNATDEQVVVSLPTPTLTTTPNVTTVTLNSAPVTLTDTATLAGGADPTGTITFTLLYNGVATTESETVTVTGDGPYTTPVGFTLPTTGTVTGTYQWDASYSGDTNNGAVSDDNATDEQVVVSPASSTPPGVLTLTTAPNVTTVTLSSATPPVLTDTADLEGAYNPTGTITFTLLYNGVATTESETVTVTADGKYTTPTGFTLPTTGTVAGTYQWDASYSGDGNNSAISDNGATDEQVVVSPASSTGTPPLTFTTTPGGTVVIGSGVNLTDSATLSGGFIPTGTITFYLFLPGVTPNGTDSNNVYSDVVTVSGNNTYTTASGSTPGGFTPTAAGLYQWVAVYSGDNNNSTATSLFTDEPETVNPTVIKKTSLATTFPLGANGAGIEGPIVNLENNGSLVSIADPFPGFTGEITRATGVLPNGDAFVVWGAGPSSSFGPEVKVVDLVTGATLAQFDAFAPSFTGGVFVAVGDVNGDGTPDIIVGAGPGGGPEVKVIDGTKLGMVNAAGEIEDSALLADFFAYAPNFTGGVTVAAADFNGDGLADIVTGAGPGGGPEVKVIDATKLGMIVEDPSSPQLHEIQDGALLADFFAYAPTFSGGVFVATGDVNGDGVPDLVTGAGAGGGAEVKVIDGTMLGDIVTNGTDLNEISDAALLGDFFAYDHGFIGGVRVDTVIDPNTGLADIVTGAGPGGGPHVKVVDATKLGEIVTDPSSSEYHDIMDSALVGNNGTDGFFATAADDPNGVFV